jgi:hypothetical protein
MGRQKVGLQCRNRIVAALKCISTVDHAGPRFWYCLTQAFGKAIIETSKIHNLFIQYPNNAYFSALESS